MEQANETVTENGRLSLLIEERENELAELKKLYGSKESELNSIKSSVEVLESKNAEIEKQQEGLNRERDSLSKQLEEKQIELETANHSYQKAKEEMLEIQSKLSGTTADLNDMSDRYNSLKQKLDTQKPTGINTEVTNLKSMLERVENTNDELLREKDRISGELKKSQEQLYYETSRNESLEKKITHLNRQSSTRSSRSSTLGQLDVSQTFKKQTYERMNELQQTIDNLKMGKNSDYATIKSLEQRLADNRDKNFKIFKFMLQRLLPLLGKDWSKKSEELENGKSNSQRDRVNAMERLTCGALDAFINDVSTKLKENDKHYSKLLDQLKQSQKRQQETGSSMKSLQAKLDQLQSENDNLSSKTKNTMLDVGQLKNASTSSNEVRKEIFKQISGTFVGKIWLSRYHEMEKRWHNERETRKREYDGYKQHLNECYDRIESQKKAIGKLQMRIKSLNEGCGEEEEL